MDKKCEKIQFVTGRRRFGSLSSIEEECSKTTSYSSSRDNESDSSRKRQKNSNQVNALQELTVEKKTEQKETNSSSELEDSKIVNLISTSDETASCGDNYEAGTSDNSSSDSSDNASYAYINTSTEIGSQYNDSDESTCSSNSSELLIELVAIPNKHDEPEEHYTKIFNKVLWLFNHNMNKNAEVLSDLQPRALNQDTEQHNVSNGLHGANLSSPKIPYVRPSTEHVVEMMTDNETTASINEPYESDFDEIHNDITNRSDAFEGKENEAVNSTISDDVDANEEEEEEVENDIHSDIDKCIKSKESSVQSNAENRLSNVTVNDSKPKSSRESTNISVLPSNVTSPSLQRKHRKNFFPRQSNDTVTDKDNVLSNTDNFETNVPLDDNPSATYDSAQTNNVINYKECNKKPKLVDATAQTSYEDYISGKWDVLKIHFFSGKSKFYNVCTCNDHKCSNN